MKPQSRPALKEFLQRIASDPVVFAHELWDVRGWKTVAPLSEIEEDIIRFAAGLTSPEEERGILAPRSIGKTHLVPLNLGLFRLVRDPQRKILVISKTEDFAKDIIEAMRMAIDDVWFLQFLKPRRGQRDDRIRKQKDTTFKFDVGPAIRSVQPSVTAIGVEGQLEGKRGHSIFPDDIETKKNTEGPEMRLKLAERTNEFASVQYAHKPYAEGGPIDAVETVFVGTYHHEESVYHKLAAKGYHVRVWPLCSPQKDDNIEACREDWQGRIELAPIIKERLESGQLKYSIDEDDYPNNPIIPLRFPAREIRKRQKKGRTYFAMQFMLVADLGDTERYPLRLEDLMVFDVPKDKAPIVVEWGRFNQYRPNDVPYSECPFLGFQGDRLLHPIFVDDQRQTYSRRCAFVDPAGRGTDKTGVSIAFGLNGLLFIPAVLGLPGGHSDEQMDALAKTLRSYGVTEAFYESNVDTFDSYGNLFDQMLRQNFLEPGQSPDHPAGWKCSLQKRKVHGSKEERILDVLEPAFSRHRVVIDPKALKPEPGEPMEHTLQYQLTRLRRIKKCLTEDGKIDSLASLIAEFTEDLNVNVRGQADKLRPETGEDTLLGLIGRFKKKKEPARWFSRI